MSTFLQDRAVGGFQSTLGADRATVHPGWLCADQLPVLETMPRNAEDSERFAAFAQLMKTAGALDRAATECLSDLGLTAGAFFALLELDGAGETGLAPSELARRLAVARRTATLYVDILTRQGWVERTPHPDDRRMVLAHLTDDGHRLVDNHIESYKKRLADLVGVVNAVQSARMRQLLALIEVDDDHDAEHGQRSSAVGG